MKNSIIKYYLSMGTNLGDRSENIKKAVSLLGELVEIKAVSSVHKTEPVGMREGTPYFYNIAVEIETDYSPEEMLKITQDIEKKMGRKAKSKNNIYEDRIIDIDILLADSLIIKTENLEIPHPEILKRKFVLLPLNELNPELKHPNTGKKLNAYL